MAGDITYGVNVEYLTSGNLSIPTSALDKAKTSFDSLQSAAHSFNSVLDGIIGSLVSVATATATAVGTIAVTGIALATHHAIAFNKEMEDTQTNLAAIANANEGLNGFKSPAEAFGNQYRLAGDVIKEMRKDARELPGEFHDLQNMMTLMMPAASNAGLGMFETEKLAARSMAIAASLQVPFATAGREMGNIISGTVTGRMPMFTKMGLGDAKDWNKKTIDQRLDALQKKESAFGPSLGSVQKNWSTVSSNFVDTLKQGVGVVGGPLLDRVKGAMEVFNNSDKTNFAMIGERIGGGLVKAFDYGQVALEKWIPLAHTFVGTMERGFERVFAGLGPMFDIILPRIESFLKDPAAFSKLESIVSELVALRVGGAAVEGGAGLAGGILRSGPALEAVGIEAGPAALALGVALGLGAIALEGFTHALTDSTSSVHDTAVKSSKTMIAASGRLHDQVFGSTTAIQQAMDLFGVGMGRIGEHVIGTLADLATIVNVASDAVTAFGNFLASFVPGAARLKNRGDPFEMLLADERAKKEAAAYTNSEAFADMFLKPMGGNGYGNPPPKPPPNNTHIGQVIIKVDGNQDPRRIAKEIHGILQSDAYFPKTTTLPSSPAGVWAGHR